MRGVVACDYEQAEGEHVGGYVEVGVEDEVGGTVVQVHLDGTGESGVNVKSLGEVDGGDRGGFC